MYSIWNEISVWMSPLWSTKLKVVNDGNQKAPGMLFDYLVWKCSIWKCVEVWLKALTAKLDVVEDLICFWQRTGQRWKGQVQWELLSNGNNMLNLHDLHEDLRWLRRYLDSFYKVPAVSSLSLLMLQLYRLTSVFFSNVAFYGGSSRWIIWT